MLCVIPFHKGDAECAKNLLRWIGQLGGCKRHDAVLVIDAATPWDDGKEAVALARPCFAKVTTVCNPEPVPGWIPGSNSLFRTAASFAAGRPFFWLEPDAVPLRSGWLDEIENHYANCRRLFMGTLVKHHEPLWPNPYLEGCAVYPSDCWNRISPLWNPRVSWTRATAPATVPMAAHTPLIQHIWGESGRAPTFAAERVPGTNVFDVGSLDPQAVLFHRCKDGSLINLLREKIGFATQHMDPRKDPACFVQMGRFGDIVLMLPAYRAIYERMGVKPVVVTSGQFGSVFEGVSYVEAVPLRLHWHNDYDKAIQWAKEHYPDPVPIQLHGHGVEAKPDSLASYSLSMWSRTGLLPEYEKLPLVFDLRSPDREAKLVARYRKQPDKPMIVFTNNGWTSPLKDPGKLWTDLVTWFSGEAEIINLADIQAWRVYDMLGFFDRAAGLISIDTLHIHLAAASKVPYVALVRDDGQSGSIPKGNCVLKVGYKSVKNRVPEILNIVRQWITSSAQATMSATPTA